MLEFVGVARLRRRLLLLLLWFLVLCFLPSLILCIDNFDDEIIAIHSSIALATMGKAVALSSDGLIATAGENNLVRVFNRTSVTSMFVEAQVITGAGGGFGLSALALSGDGSTLAVGAWVESSQTGSCYVYWSDGLDFSDEQKILAGNGESKDNYGSDAALNHNGDTLVVSAYHEDGGSGNPLFRAGAVYVYWFDGARFGTEQIIHSSAPHVNARYGSRVAISANSSTEEGTLAVGCPEQRNLNIEPRGIDAGACYIYWLSANDGEYIGKYRA
jgi:WD40 repeat protein